MRLLATTLVLLLVLLQYKLWLGDGGLLKIRRLNAAVESQSAENATLRERNRALEAEVYDLKKGRGAIEERARTELGMIREGETFYQVVED
ncbi:cell division protein FtsB [Thiohalomonas denitrificans]|uniref:cell division protein FtsB n=1 Tax=Thiohalomonas denitrificans TaxID=415747 RepID=UPI0026ECB143|nr:cell division protein FtsB [Thiohalomonas denitrificans]